MEPARLRACPWDMAGSHSGGYPLSTCPPGTPRGERPCSTRRSAGTSRFPKRWPARVRSSAVQAISLAHFSLTFARGVAANSINKRMRLQAEVDRLKQEIALLQEETRIKDSRMLRIPAQRRPHYPPTERLAILELRAARAWSTAETARRLLVTPLTVSSWMIRLDEEGPDALVRFPNR